MVWGYSPKERRIKGKQQSACQRSFPHVGRNPQLYRTDSGQSHGRECGVFSVFLGGAGSLFRGWVIRLGPVCVFS